MKKLTAVLLILLALTATACAETLHLYQTDVPAAFAAAHPDVTYVMNASPLHDQPDDLIYCGMQLYNALLTGGFQWDVFRADTTEADIPLLMEKGYLLDLSSSEVIRDFIARLYPDIAAQCTYDGKIFAVPEGINDAASVYSVSMRSWQEMGYAEADVPKTFGAYLDFLDAWLDRREDDPYLTMNVEAAYTPTVYDSHSYAKMLVDMLLDSYIAQKLYADGALRFDDPELAALLERTKAVGERIYTFEPTKTEDNSAHGLFGNMVGQFEFADRASRQVDLRLREDQPTLTPFSLALRCAYAGTQEPELAVELIEQELLAWLDFKFHDRFIAMMCVDGQPVRNEGYDETARLAQNYLDMIQRRVDGDDTPYTEYIDMTGLDGYWESMRNYAEKLRKMTDAEARDELEEQKRRLEENKRYEYAVSPDDLAAWQGFAQHLYFPGPHVFNTDEGQENFLRLKRQFVDGLISAEQLVSELNRIAWMMENE